MLEQLPPHATDLEVLVLGACCLEKEAMQKVSDILDPNSFYKREHQEIYSAMLDLQKENNPVDIFTVAEKLTAKKVLKSVGGAVYISQLTNKVASSANVDYHARIVKQKQIGRELIALCQRTMSAAYSPEYDVFDLIDEHGKTFTEISTVNSTNEDTNVEREMLDLIEVNKKLQETGEIVGMPTGIYDLDNLLRGMQGGDLDILAARPSIGKTALALQIARHGIRDNKHIAFISLEMSGRKLVKRLLAQETGMGRVAGNLGREAISDQEITQLTSLSSDIINQRFHIIEEFEMSENALKNKLRQLKRDHNIQFIVLDYLQLLSDKNAKGNRETVISGFSRAAKSIAKELDVPFLALSQVSRAVETRGGDKRPMLSDLRESGAIEQDADAVMFLYRPEVYNIDQDEHGNKLDDGYTEIIVAKNRDGAVGTVESIFENNTTKFKNIDEAEPAPMQPNTDFNEPVSDKPF